MARSLVALLVVALVCGGAWAQPKEDKKKTAKVTGTIEFKGKVTFDPQTIVVVTVQDVSLADAPARVIGKQTIKSPKATPIPFEVAYNPSVIVARNRYTVSARITLKGKLLFINDTSIPVITNKAPTRSVKLPVIAVKR